MNDDFKNYIQLLIDNKDKITHLPERDIHNLLDYITNLQQRIEKAVEYIKENAWYMNKDDEEILDRVGIEGLLDILNGDK